MSLSKLSKIVIIDNLPTPNQNETRRVYPTPPNSPPRTKPDHPKLQKEFENELRSSKPATSSRLNTPPTEKESPGRPTASALKGRLGLSNEQCGSITKAGTPCKRAIPKNARQRINSLISSMTPLIQSSPGLDAKLEELARLALCRDHNHDEKKESRIKDWKEVFPDGDVSAKPTLVSIENRIKKVLGPLRVECVAIMESGESCEERIGGQKVYNCRRSIAEIIKLEVFSNDEYLEGFLSVLETNMYCGIHVENRTLERTVLWKSQIKAISNSYSREPPTAEQPRFVAPDFSLGFANFWPKAFDVSPFKLIGRLNGYPGSFGPTSSYQKIQEKMRSLLIPDDQNDGYVYLYEVEGNKGLVKIGYTTRTITERHREWRFECNRNPKSLYPIPYATAVRVPNARRIEGLCHAELDYCRKKFYCRSCLKLHIEWFEVSSEKAISVIQRWSKWMQTKPYQPRELKEGVKWSLKEEERQRAMRIDKFMSDTSVVVTQDSQQTPP